MSDAIDDVRKRAYHRDRAIVKKIANEGSALATDRMTDMQLWTCGSRLVYELWAHTREGRDVQSARLARDLEKVMDELFVRGVQLTLPV